MFAALCANVSGALAHTIRSTYGPLGADKMLVSASNRVLITNSGHAILQSLVTSHPVCRLMVDAITAHSARYGDGATALTLMAHAAWAHIAALIETDGRAHTLGTRAAAAAAATSSATATATGVTALGTDGGDGDGDLSSLRALQRAEALQSDAQRRRYRGHCTALYLALSHVHRVWLAPIDDEPQRIPRLLRWLQLTVGRCVAAPASNSPDAKAPTSGSRSGSGTDTALRSAVTALVKTAFQGKFAPSAVDSLSALLTDLIFRSRGGSQLPLHRVLERIGVDEAIVLCFPSPLHQSAVASGVIVDTGRVAARAMATALPRAVSTASASATLPGDGFGVWILQCAFDHTTAGFDVGATPVALEAASAEAYAAFLQSGNARVTALVKAAAVAGIQLIVSLLQLHDATVACCAVHGITVLHGVRREQLERVALFTGAHPIASMSGVNVDRVLLHAGAALSFQQMVSGTKVCWQLLPLPNRPVRGGTDGAGLEAHTIVLGGGSEGLCRQYEQALVRATQLIAQCSRSSEPAAFAPAATAATKPALVTAAGAPASPHGMWLCSGGGAAELELYFLFSSLAAHLDAAKPNAATATAAASGPSVADTKAAGASSAALERDALVSAALALHSPGANRMAAHHVAWAYRVLAAAVYELPFTLFANSFAPPLNGAGAAAGATAVVVDGGASPSVDGSANAHRHRRIVTSFLKAIDAFRVQRQSGQFGAGFVAWDDGAILREIALEHSALTSDADGEGGDDDANRLPDDCSLRVSRNPSRLPATSSLPTASTAAATARAPAPAVVESVASKVALIEQLFGLLCPLLRIGEVVRTRKGAKPRAHRRAAQFVRPSKSAAGAAAAASSSDDGDDDTDGDDS